MTKASMRNANRVWSPEARELLKRRITALLIRGLIESEIVQQLSTPLIPDGAGGMRGNPSYFENPKTHKPFNQSTINRLIHKIYDEWREVDAGRIAHWRGELIAHNIELERANWAEHDLDGVRATLDQRARLIGAFAPVKFEDVTDASTKRDLEELRDLLGTALPTT